MDTYFYENYMLTFVIYKQFNFVLLILKKRVFCFSDVYFNSENGWVGFDESFLENDIHLETETVENIEPRREVMLVSINRGKTASTKVPNVYKTTPRKVPRQMHSSRPKHLSNSNARSLIIGLHQLNMKQVKQLADSEIENYEHKCET